MDELFTGMTDQTPLGTVWIAASDFGLVAVQVAGEESAFSQELATRFGIPAIPDKFQTAQIVSQIRAYLLGERKSFDLEIHWGMLTDFQQKSLQAVCQIPYGETRTYGQIAAQIGVPRAARAVGRANATNPMPLVVPCHRLVGADGRLRGYGSGEGLKTKAWLLELEKDSRV